MDPSVIMQGAISVVSDPITLFFILMGVFVGIIFGAVPGLTATIAIIMFLPVTYTMTPIQGMSTLIALYVGGISGGLVAAILLNIPGTPSSIATTFDGTPLAAKGQAWKSFGCRCSIFLYWYYFWIINVGNNITNVSKCSYKIWSF